VNVDDSPGNAWIVHGIRIVGQLNSGAIHNRRGKQPLAIRFPSSGHSLSRNHRIGIDSGNTISPHRLTLEGNHDVGRSAMEFRLIYQGPLRAEKYERREASAEGVGRAKDKHELRKVFHLQLRELWNQHPELRSQATKLCYLSQSGEEGNTYVFLHPVEKWARSATNVKPYLDHIADNHKLCGGRFVPLVSTNGGFTCALEILFLRRDNPGGVIQSGGDIDNRIKVLFDGLRMPHTDGELGGYTIDGKDEDPFFCLLEDDTLITSVSVTTDRLITPQKDDENINDVLLVIKVTMVNPSAVFAGGRLV
jgi:hypothetical protein